MTKTTQVAFELIHAEPEFASNDPIIVGSVGGPEPLDKAAELVVASRDRVGAGVTELTLTFHEGSKSTYRVVSIDD